MKNHPIDSMEEPDISEAIKKYAALLDGGMTREKALRFLDECAVAHGFDYVQRVRTAIRRSRMASEFLF